MKKQKALEELLENEWAQMLFSKNRGLAGSLGWQLTYHVRYTQGSPAGFPDQVLIRDRIIFAELKREKGKPTTNQIEYLDGLAAAGGEVYLWRPSDIDEIAEILRKRWTLVGAHENDLRGLQLDGAPGSYWQPGSMWVCGGGRLDERPVEEPEVPGQTTILDFV